MLELQRVIPEELKHNTPDLVLYGACSECRQTLGWGRSERRDVEMHRVRI